MVSLHAFVVDVPDSLAATREQVRLPLEQAGLAVRACGGIDAALEELKTQDVARSSPVLVLLGPGLECPVAAARRIHRQAPAATFVFLTDGSNSALAQQLRSPFAMVGTHWCVVDLASQEVTGALRDAADAVRQRLHHRTTISRINIQLSTQPPADISELRRYSVSDRFLANILEHARDAIIGTNNDGMIVTWNDAAEKMFGRSRDEVAGMRIDEVAGGEWPERLRQFLAETHHSELARDELVIEGRHGRTSFVELMLSLVRDQLGDAIGLSAVVRDVTSRKQMEAERRNLEEQLRQAQKLESLGVMAGGIAHDFNNILSCILGNVELAALESPPQSAIRRFAEEARAAAVQAAELCQQMLAYTGQGLFRTQVLDLDQVLEEAAALISASVSRKAKIEYDLDGGLPAIEADAAQIRQIAVNLISNASEAIGDDDGVIAISTGVMDCDPKYLAKTLLNDHLEPGPYVYLAVKDTGCGMDRETQRKIFDPFFSTKFVGRGLGLAAVLGIVRRHSGAIEVRSQEGHGTTFKILFPVLRQDNSQAAEIDARRYRFAQPNGAGREIEEVVSQTVDEGLGVTRRPSRARR